MEDSLPIQESTYKALRTLKFYDKQWELTSFKDGGYAEFRENGKFTIFNRVRGIRLRGSVLTLVEFPATRITKSNRLSIGTMTAEEEKNGDWARLEVGSTYIGNVLQFFHDFPLRSRIPSSEDDSHRWEYNSVRNDVEDILQRVIICDKCMHEDDGWCSYYYFDNDPRMPYIKTYSDGSRITFYTSNFTLSLNPLRYSTEELYKWLKAFRMALDSMSKVSLSNPKGYPRILW